MGGWSYIKKLLSNDENHRNDDKKSIPKTTNLGDNEKNNKKSISKTTNLGDNEKNHNDEIQERIDVDKPLWNQNTYFGRWRHFAYITDVCTIFEREENLHDAKKLCDLYKTGSEPTGTTRSDVIWAKKLRDSSFHPDNGELMNLIGRMSFQLPGNIFLTAGMLAFYKTARATVGWQILNQAFNATVNYTNRNAAGIDESNDTERIKQAFVAATASSCIAALTFRKFLSSRGNLAARWAPFFAVAVGNMVNLPIMRQLEIQRGIPVSFYDTEKTPIMNSRIAAVKAIAECVNSRIIMAAPGMLLIPVIIDRFEPYCFYRKRPWIGPTMQIGMVAFFLLFMIPTALAIYPQRNSMNSELLKLKMEEYEEYQQKTKKSESQILYYNKGL